MLKAKSKCKSYGCQSLVDGPGYCAKHAANAPQDVKRRFEYLDKKKTPEQRRFYASAQWTETSRRHRADEPLCRACKKRGIVKAATLTHHNPPLEKLLSLGINPLDDRYLESSCFPCHQRELLSHKTYHNEIARPHQ